MARIITSGIFLILTILINSSTSTPAVLLSSMGLMDFADSITTKIQNILFWKDKTIGNPDALAEETLREVKGLSMQMEELKNFIDQKTDSSAMKLNQANINNTEFINAMKTISDSHLSIDIEYRKYLHFLNSKINASTTNAYLNENQNQIERLEDAINKIYNIFNSERSDHKQFVDIINYLNSYDQVRCDQAKSSQQWLFYEFNNIIISEVRAYVIMVFQRTMKVNHGKPDEAQYFRDRLTHLRDDFRLRINHYLTAFPSALNSVSRDIRRCDAKLPIRGQNYFEFEKLYQSYIINSDEISSPFCPTCGSIKSHEGHLLQSPRNPDLQNPVKTTCNGEILNCEIFPPYPVHKFEVCLRPKEERKRYNWITDKIYYYGNNIRSSHKNDDCKGGEIHSIVAHQHITYHARQYSDTKLCHFCLCTCAATNDTTSEAIRAISLIRQRSNMADNRVLIGVRLVLKDKVVHIQIKEGKLMKEGNILPGSQRWIPLETINYRDSYIIKDNHTRQNIHENYQFAYIDKYDNTMILEDLIAPSDSVIVGVGFHTYNDYYYNWKAIGLVIMAAPFNWATGKLDIDKASWMTPGTVHHKNITDENLFGKARTDLDDPLKPLFNLPAVQNGIVKFTRSDLAKDAGQSVYPYFDSQEVDTNPSFPLGGIGLFKRSTEGFGGFVAPKIFTANIIKDHIQYTVKNILQQSIYK